MKEICVKFPVPENNELTECPVWFIIDTKWYAPDENPSARDVAMLFDGPFFSREEGEVVLKNNRSRYSVKACVYCKSGSFSPSYRAAFEAARNNCETALRGGRRGTATPA